MFLIPREVPSPLNPKHTEAQFCHKGNFFSKNFFSVMFAVLIDESFH